MGNNLDGKYIIFETRNDNRFYVGLHLTTDPTKFDGYLGDGVWVNDPNTYRRGKKPLHCAILRHGIKSFKRTVLKEFDDFDEAVFYKNKLINERLVRRPDTYNYTMSHTLYDKPIYQFDKEGDLIRVWNNEIEIRQFYKCKIPMRNVVKYTILFADSYWGFDDEIEICKYNPKYIMQYNQEGMFLGIYKDTKQAADLLDLDRNAITKAIYKKKLYSGYYFLQANKDIAEIICSDFRPKKYKPPVYRYLRDGQFDREFKNVTEGARGTRRTSINAIKKALINRNLCFGFYWSYKKSDNYFNIQD